MNLNSKEIVKNPLKGKNWWQWPRPTRDFSMNLKSLSNKDVGLNEIKFRVRDSNLRTCDINKVKKPKKHRINSSLHCEDIIQKKQHFRKIIYPFDKLKNDDIEGTKTKQKRNILLRKPLDPLNPQYQLEKVPPIDIEVPKFIRDNINVDDIVGTKGQSQIKQQEMTKTNFIGDIEGSKPKREKIRKNFINSLDISDIQTKIKRKIIKDINPLEPVYQLKYQKQKEKTQIGEIEKNKSRILHKKVNKEDLQLKTEDIEGCRASSAFNKYIMGSERTYFNQTNKVYDIEGAQVNSKQNGLQTQRQTNPLDPQYQLPSQNKLDFKGELENSVDFDEQRQKMVQKCLQSIALTSREYNIINFVSNPYYQKPQKITIKKPKDFQTKSEKKLQQIKKNREQIITQKKMNDQKENDIKVNKNSNFSGQKPQKQKVKKQARLSQTVMQNTRNKSTFKFKIRNENVKKFQTKDKPTYAEKFMQLCSNQICQFY